MSLFKCKMCGGALELTEGNSIATCEYCGTTQTVPSADNEKKLTLFGRANRLRAACEFDKAFGVYEAIVADFPEEAEAYWGLVLCKYGIEYVDDPKTGKKIPTCHRSSFESVMDDANFEQVLENSDPLSRGIYRDEAKQIEEIRKGIVEISSKEDPYDIFICYKETDENGNRTLDSVLAQDVYDALTEKGYRVFFSRITLEDKLGQEYEPYIFAALNSAKVMLAFGSNYEYYNAVWVKNEWSRFLELISKGEKKTLIPCYKNIDAYDMPKEFAKLQAQDMGKVGAIQDLLRGIDKIISTDAPAPTSAPKGADVGQLLTLGNESLEKGEWGIASSRFDLALTVDPMCAEAYLGKLMVDMKCKKREQLSRAKKRLNKNAQYKLALTYADESLKQELESYSKKTAKRFRKRITAILVLILLIAAGITALELNYRVTINQFYAGDISASTAHKRLDAWSWYKKPDTCTKALIEKSIPGTYPHLANVKALTIPKGVTSIGKHTFDHYSSLTSITIPDSVTSIDDYAFRNCHLTSITIPNSVTSIGYGAFYACKLTSITIPSSVTHIGDSSFGACRSLTDIVIPDGITHIGGSTFWECLSLTTIILPDSVTSIGNYAFKDCSGLASMPIPDSVTSIGDEAFYNCSKLTSIRFNGTKAQWYAIQKGYNWDYNTGNYTVYCTDGTIEK